MSTLQIDMHAVDAGEKAQYADELRAVFAATNRLPPEKVRAQFDSESYVKVEWDRVFDLVEHRRIFIRGGMAYVPSGQLANLVVAEFSKKLDEALIATARLLPRLDEDDRLGPILNHLSKGFSAPEYNAAASPATLSGEAITAGQIDGLKVHFPLCMRNLHSALRRDKHLRHFGRLQYGLFLKHLGLSIDEALIFWRQAFTRKTDEEFNKEYRYNIRHSYGLQGAGRNYAAYNCQQILMDHPPGTGDAHGCPYRHFSVDNLMLAMESQMGIPHGEKSVLSSVRQDVEQKKFHVACNKVFEHLHERELRREKEAGVGPRETITHPNEWFDRSWNLKNPGKAKEREKVKQEVKEEDAVMT
ncbi:hypothetical protein ABW21_db0200250 [Orbilia brochopaga]|nr:hypothetical protein ABW21_db0200250 [Drechslerella brochopaga]